MKSSGLLRQGMGYGLVGVVQILLDWATFVALSALGVLTIPANLGGRLAGASLGFWLNGVFTFSHETGSRLGWRRLWRYALTWGAMACMSTVAMYLVDHYAGLKWAWMAKPVVDGFLAVLAFLASRHWIYK